MQQQQPSTTPTSDEPESRQQQQRYTSPTLVIQPGNRSNTRRPQYISSNSLVSNDFRQIDDAVDDYSSQSTQQLQDDNESQNAAVAVVANTLVSTSIVVETVDDINEGTEDQNITEIDNTQDVGRCDASKIVPTIRSIRSSNSIHSSSEIAPSVVVVDETFSTTTPQVLVRRSTPSILNNRPSFRHVSDRNRPELEINLEENDMSFLQGDDFDSNTMSTACGWTEVMSSTTIAGRGTAGMVPRAAGTIGEGLVGFNTNIGNNTTMPSPRSLHSAALLNGVMYIFGGYDGTQRVNSFHAYTFADKRWSPVSKTCLQNDFAFLCVSLFFAILSFLTMNLTVFVLHGP
jgi:Kelch motif